jgi:hypothetical protein
MQVWPEIWSIFGKQGPSGLSYRLNLTFYSSSMREARNQGDTHGDVLKVPTICIDNCKYGDNETIEGVREASTSKARLASICASTVGFPFHLSVRLRLIFWLIPLS